MFKHADYFDYNIEGARSNNCILIDTKNWIANSSNEIVGYNTRGGILTNYITEVLATNIREDNSCYGLIGVGDIVLLTATATRVYNSHTFNIPVGYDDIKYTDIPTTHVIGKFADKKISLPTLKLFNDFVLLQQEDIGTNSTISLVEKNRTVYKVIRTSDKVESVTEGDVVLVGDNVTTPITLSGIEYYVISESLIIALLNMSVEDKRELTAELIRPLKDYTVYKDYQSEKVYGTTLIAKPEYDETKDEFTSALYTEDFYEVIESDLDILKEHDIVMVSRAATNYVTYNGIRYYTTRGKQFLEARIRR